MLVARDRCRGAVTVVVVWLLSPSLADMLMTPELRPARIRRVYAALSIACIVLLCPDGVLAQSGLEATRASGARGVSARANVCDTGWTAPRVLRTAKRQPIYVEAPLTVASTRATYLVGAPAFVWADSETFATETSWRSIGAVGVQLLSDSTVVPLPPLPSATKPYMPIAVARGAKLLAMWATSWDTSAAGVFNLDTLWEATLSAGRWSAPRPIWSSGILTWHPGAASFVSDDSTLLLAFPAKKTSPERPGVTIMTRSRKRWGTRWFEVGSVGPNAVAAMKLSASELLVAAVGSIERDGVRGDNAGYTMRISLDDSTSMPRFQVIHDEVHLSAEDPNVFRTSDGLHFVWRKGGRSVYASDSLTDATSRDGGASWAVTSTISLDSDMRGMRATSLGAHAAIALALDGRRGSIVSRRWQMGRWSAPQKEFTDAKTIPVSSMLHDRFTLAFGQTRPSRGPMTYDAPVLVTASRALRCEPTSATSSRQRLRAPPRGKSTLP